MHENCCPHDSIYCDCGPGKLSDPPCCAQCVHCGENIKIEHFEKHRKSCRQYHSILQKLESKRP